MIRRALGALMDWAIARNGGGTYEGEDSPRWAYTIRGEDGSAYLSRLLLPRVRLGGFQFRPMLHRFHRPDADGDLHNHPWTFGLSLVLVGGYLEERLDLARGHGATMQRWVRGLNLLTWRDFHRVVELLGQNEDGTGEVWTLFVTGERIQDWGFLEVLPGTFTQWERYLARKKETP